MENNIKNFLLKEVKAYKSYKKLSQYNQGILYAYEMALLFLERQEKEGK